MVIFHFHSEEKKDLVTKTRFLLVPFPHSGQERTGLSVKGERLGPEDACLQTDPSSSVENQNKNVINSVSVLCGEKEAG